MTSSDIRRYPRPVANVQRQPPFPPHHQQLLSNCRHPQIFCHNEPCSQVIKHSSVIILTVTRRSSHTCFHLLDIFIQLWCCQTSKPAVKLSSVAYFGKPLTPFRSTLLTQSLQRFLLFFYKFEKNYISSKYRVPGKISTGNTVLYFLK
jgi:hypothetical protein